MALLFTDSFDDRTTSLQNRYNVSSGAAGIASAAGRTGNGLQLAQRNSLYCWFQKDVPARKTLIVGLAYKQDTWSTAQQIVGLMDRSETQVRVVQNADRTVTVYRGVSTALGSSSAGQTLQSGVWSYIQLKVTIDSSAGVVTLRVNGVDWITLSGINTQATVNALADRVKFGPRDDEEGPGFQFPNAFFDDIYICDSLGAANNDFLGAVKVYALLPESQGTSSQWTPNTGANWQCVDDATPDDDTTYVSTNSVGAKDLYNLPSLSAAGDVLAVALNARARKDDLAPRTYQTAIRHSATDSNLTTSDLTDAYRDDQWQMDTNPVTDADWTQADINNLQIGVRLSG